MNEDIELMISELQHSDIYIRRRAAFTLVQIGTPEGNQCSKKCLN